MYIEVCATKDASCWQAFGDMNGAVQMYSSDPERWAQYREWLISVIYLSPSDKYFCACLGQIENSYQHGKYHPTIASLAIRDFIRKHEQRCWSLIADKDFTEDSTWAEEEGLDPKNLPPLDSLGLGFLLDNLAVNTDALPRAYIGSFGASPNPFSGEIAVSFLLNRTSHVQIQVFNVLGQIVWEGASKSYTAGEHRLTIDGNTLDRGTYFTRITTGLGEVKTVKLVKE